MTPKYTIKVVDYDPSWKKTFEELQEAILPVFADFPVKIEHVGSTSIFNLAAKPIIDFNIIIPSIENLPEAINRLAKLGYEHEGDLGLKGRDAFRCPTEYVPFTTSNRTWPKHHMYVCPSDGLELERQLLFRDYLREHTDKMFEYGDLKRKLAAKFPHDIRSYIDGKKNFVEEIIVLARQQNSTKAKDPE